MQLQMFDQSRTRIVTPFKQPLLKWIGSKQRFAHEIGSYFPVQYGTYFEPFIGSGAVLGTLAPSKAVGSDTFAPLVEIWQTLQSSQETLVEWYETRWNAMMKGDKKEEYERIKASCNSNPNGADMLFLCRSCYGGVVRFRKRDGYMSTPCGIHTPIHPDTFARRAQEWQRRTSGTDFRLKDYEEIMESAESGDLIYCDPPYTYTQSILYGAQSFDLQNLLRVIQNCKSRNVFVALSIDGSKRSGDFICDLPIPTGLFEREVFVNIGKSMLKRFQMEGKSMEGEEVSDRLLLTY